MNFCEALAPLSYFLLDKQFLAQHYRIDRKIAALLDLAAPVNDAAGNLSGRPHRPGKMTQSLEIVGVDGGAGLYLYSDQAASAFGQEIDLIPVTFPVEEKVAPFPLYILAVGDFLCSAIGFPSCRARSGLHFFRPVISRVGTAFQGSSGQGCLG